MLMFGYCCDWVVFSNVCDLLRWVMVIFRFGLFFVVWVISVFSVGLLNCFYYVV